ncbi:MAG: AAA family ATPase [Deltaproteobacteria bacterium]|nr:AAA family ATPase [Deltaproteobacteria bacterium]
MDEDLRKRMLSPDFYPHRPSQVKEIQTHISHVFIAPPFVYKVKKPVDFGFLDFTTLARRCFYTFRELLLNSRFSPDLYLEVLPITFNGNTYQLSGKGEHVEYALVMNQFDETRTMKRLIEDGTLTDGQVEELAKRLADIHGKAQSIKPEIGLGSYASVRYDCEENFDQLAPFVGDFVDKGTWSAVKEGTLGFLERHQDLFQFRLENGFIRDCHGDLHTEHIIFEDKAIYIFDCIEFNERFRFIDTMSDLAFLIMELIFLEQSNRNPHLLDPYFSHIQDPWGPLLIDFYACYRATVRAKVHAFTAGDPSVPTLQRERSRALSRSYLSLAKRLIQRYARPWLVLTMGFSGTGKTTVAKALRERSGIEVLSSDVVRKELLKNDASSSSGWNEGIYRPESRAQVYERMFEKAREVLGVKGSLCLDASFLDAVQREQALAIAKEMDVNFLAIVCHCDEDQVKRLLEKRQAEGSDPSDADFDIYLKQKEAFKGWAPIPAFQRFPVDTTEGIPERELSLLASFVS